MSRVKGTMVPAGPCDEVYVPALSRGELIPCVKTERHYKHLGHDMWTDADGQIKTGDLFWWGDPLSDEDRAEVERIRALGGVDTQKLAQWIEDLAKSIEEES